MISLRQIVSPIMWGEVRGVCSIHVVGVEAIHTLFRLHWLSRIKITHPLLFVATELFPEDCEYIL